MCTHVMCLCVCVCVWPGIDSRRDTPLQGTAEGEQAVCWRACSWLAGRHYLTVRNRGYLHLANWRADYSWQAIYTADLRDKVEQVAANVDIGTGRVQIPPLSAGSVHRHDCARDQAMVCSSSPAPTTGPLCVLLPFATCPASTTIPARQTYRQAPVAPWR